MEVVVVVAGVVFGFLGRFFFGFGVVVATVVVVVVMMGQAPGRIEMSSMAMSLLNPGPTTPTNKNC